MDPHSVNSYHFLPRNQSPRVVREELTSLHKELESHPEAGSNADDMKKAKIGLINLKAHLNQVDCEQFATYLKNTFLFKVNYNALILIKSHFDFT